MKYKYIGDHEKHLPSHGITVKKGDIVETEKPINHPEFELLEEIKEQPRKDSK